MHSNAKHGQDHPETDEEIDNSEEASLTDGVKTESEPESFACRFCDKVFNSSHGRNMHSNAKHGQDHPETDEEIDNSEEASSDNEQLPLPFDSADGYWVRRIEFMGDKSFGYFKCQCKKWWMSAHSQTKYKQGCKSCNKFSLPEYLWVNNHRN